MSRDPRPRQETLRVPPVVAGVAGAVAERLREESIPLDDVSRARMERSLVQAWRTHASARVPLPRAADEPAPARARTAVWAASLAISGVCGALVGLYALHEDGAASRVRPGTAHFELRIGDAAVQSGQIAEGQVLESGKHGHIEVDLGSALIDMARGSRVRFDRMAIEELRLSLVKGRIDVDFHPAERGRQRMLIESRAGSVAVVGTRFAVDVDALGNTEVRVTEGVVEVTPRDGGEVRRIEAGHATVVRVDEGNAFERAVRDAIEENMHAAVDEEPGVLATDEPAEVLDLTLPGAMPERVRTALGPAGIARRLDTARQLLRDGRHAQARSRLEELASDGAIATHYRAEALTLIAESYTAQGQIPRATAAYERVVVLAAGHAAAHNAQFALARLLERYTDNREVAAAAYDSYLQQAPSGALAPQAREALCRLGRASACQR